MRDGIGSFLYSFSVSFRLRVRNDDFQAESAWGAYCFIYAMEFYESCVGACLVCKKGRDACMHAWKKNWEAL